MTPLGKAVAAFTIAGLVAGAADKPHHNHHHGGGSSLMSIGAAPLHGHWATFLAAVRAQETGGSYNQDSPGCLGAYCWAAQANWDSMARTTGLGRYAGQNPASLPRGVQDRVASISLRRIYRQTGSLRDAAAWWNGGSTASLPNPALPAQPWAPQCGGGSSYAYACQVLTRMNLRGQYLA